MRADVQAMLWKAADQQGAPNVDINNFGWDVNDGKPQPVTAKLPPAPPAIMKVLVCCCQAENPCARNTCSCRAANVSGTRYSKCEA
ncbi:hypothetical protein LSAT2_026176, partial [Lamellibrachia satsuma]